jgi:hypothetical protein
MNDLQLHQSHTSTKNSLDHHYAELLRCSSTRKKSNSAKRLKFSTYRAVTTIATLEGFVEKYLARAFSRRRTASGCRLIKVVECVLSVAVSVAKLGCAALGTRRPAELGRLVLLAPCCCLSPFWGSRLNIFSKFDFNSRFLRANEVQLDCLAGSKNLSSRCSWGQHGKASTFSFLFCVSLLRDSNHK